MVAPNFGGRRVENLEKGKEESKKRLRGGGGHPAVLLGGGQLPGTRGMLETKRKGRRKVLQ